MLIDVDALVLSNDRLSPEYNVVRLAAAEIGASTEPGQFVMVRQGLSLDPLLRRPFSVFEILRDDNDRVSGISLLNKVVGAVTGMLFTIEPGQRLQCLGPLGQPFSVIKPPARAWMVAGGVGLAPFLTLAESLRSASTDTTLFYGGRSAGELYYLDKFESLGVRMALTTNDGSLGEAGLVTAPLKRELQALGEETPLRIYACGPTEMMRAVAALGHQYRYPSEVSLEQVMGCGLGGCYSCVVPIHEPGGQMNFVRSCLEGPVFPGDRINWNGIP